MITLWLNFSTFCDMPSRCRRFSLFLHFDDDSLRKYRAQSLLSYDKNLRNRAMPKYSFMLHEGKSTKHRVDIELLTHIIKLFSKFRIRFYLVFVSFSKLIEIGLKILICFFDLHKLCITIAAFFSIYARAAYFFFFNFYYASLAALFPTYIYQNIIMKEIKIKRPMKFMVFSWFYGCVFFICLQK
jgi:hypothetical protein